MSQNTPAQALTELREDDLLRLAANGDRGAFACFYDRTASRILGVIRGVVTDPERSEEIAQDVFVELWQIAPRFDPGEGRALAWTLTLAHRRASERADFAGDA